MEGRDFRLSMSALKVTRKSFNVNFLQKIDVPIQGIMLPMPMLTSEVLSLSIFVPHAGEI